MKRYFVVCVSVVLAVTLSIYSCFAITPTYFSDSGGSSVSSRSINNGSSASYTLVNSKEITYGAYPSNYRTTLAASSTYTSSNGDSYPSIASKSYSSYVYGAHLNIPSGTTFTYTQSASFSSSTYSSILLSGTFNFGLRVGYYGGGKNTSYLYPNKAQLMVNGSVVGSAVSGSNGVFTFPATEVSISSNVTSLGVRFTYSSAQSVSDTDTSVKSIAFSLDAMVVDSLTSSGIEVADTDYVPYFITVISWLQSIASSVSPISSQLSVISELLSPVNSNLSIINTSVRAVETAVKSLSTSMGDTQTALDRLVSVFARDDDLQLRDDVDPLIHQATDAFYRADEPGAVSPESIADTRRALSGAAAGFQSGYTTSDAFYEIASGSDDYLSWFSSDTAGWLDTTGSAVSADDDEEDKFNHWRVDQQYAEIRRRRGEGD